MIAVRSTSGDPEKFKATVKKVADSTKLPMILCSLNPSVLEAGLMAAPKLRPLLYAATKENWKDMAELALMYSCPLVVSAPNDLNTLVSLSKTLVAYGVTDLVFDPGTFINEGLARHHKQLHHATKSSSQRRRRTRWVPTDGCSHGCMDGQLRNL